MTGYMGREYVSGLEEDERKEKKGLVKGRTVPLTTTGFFVFLDGPPR